MARVLAFIGFYVIVYIILVVFFRGMRGGGYIALSGSVRGFNRSWMDLSTKRFTKLTEGNMWVVWSENVLSYSLVVLVGIDFGI